MERNFFRRIETAFPIKRRAHRERILKDLDVYLADNTQAWQLGPDGVYHRAIPGDHKPVCAQEKLLEMYAVGPGYSL